jgi:DNA-binding response OmpR family regulator
MRDSRPWRELWDGAVMPTFLFGSPTKRNTDARLAGGQAVPGHRKPRVRPGRRVLIVEDEAMIARLIETILSEAGYSIVGPVATLERALATIERERFDAALLDVRITGHDAYPVADVLGTRGIPFIFVSGFSRKQMPPRYRDCAHIAKPFMPDAILALLNEIVGRTRL